jgi:hypothetical protein
LWAGRTLAQTTAAPLIDAENRNGNFEQISLPPWFRSFLCTSDPNGVGLTTKSIEIVEDAAFAAEGNRYLKMLVSGDPQSGRVNGKINLNLKNVNLENGRNFTLSFAARNGGTNGFGRVIAELVCLSSEGKVELAKVTPVPDSATELVSEKWSRFQFLFVVSDNVLDLEWLELRIHFIMSPSNPDITYEGFLDNVTFMQSK